MNYTANEQNVLDAFLRESVVGIPHHLSSPIWWAVLFCSRNDLFHQRTDQFVRCADR